MSEQPREVSSPCGPVAAFSQSHSPGRSWTEPLPHPLGSQDGSLIPAGGYGIAWFLLESANLKAGLRERRAKPGGGRESGSSGWVRTRLVWATERKGGLETDRQTGKDREKQRLKDRNKEEEVERDSKNRETRKH